MLSDVIATRCLLVEILRNHTEWERLIRLEQNTPIRSIWFFVNMQEDLICFSQKFHEFQLSIKLCECGKRWFLAENEIRFCIRLFCIR